MLTSPDLTHLIQPVVSRNGWSSEQHVALHLNGTFGSALVVEGAMMGVPELVVYYMDPAAVAPTHMTTFHRVAYAMNQRTESRVSGFAIPTDPFLVGLGGHLDVTPPNVIALRFVNIPVPPTATILSATLTLEVAMQHAEFTSCVISADLASTSPALVNTTRFLADRPRSAATITWENMPMTVGRVGEALEAPDVSASIHPLFPWPRAITLGGTLHALLSPHLPWWNVAYPPLTTTRWLTCDR